MKGPEDDAAFYVWYRPKEAGGVLWHAITIPMPTLKHAVVGAKVMVLRNKDFDFRGADREGPNFPEPEGGDI